jgi:hypothetical protein
VICLGSLNIDVSEIFCHFPLDMLSALTNQSSRSREGGLRVGHAFIELWWNGRAAQNSMSAQQATHVEGRRCHALDGCGARVGIRYGGWATLPELIQNFQVLHKIIDIDFSMFYLCVCVFHKWG